MFPAIKDGDLCVVFRRQLMELLGEKYAADDVISYMATGLTGLNREECDLLSSYLFRWGMDERAWRREAPWRQPPDGSGKALTEKDEQRLLELNDLRQKLAAPLLRFAKA